jgi:hypothetical protein
MAGKLAAAESPRKFVSTLGKINPPHTEFIRNEVVPDFSDLKIVSSQKQIVPKSNYRPAEEAGEGEPAAYVIKEADRPDQDETSYPFTRVPWNTGAVIKQKVPRRARPITASTERREVYNLVSETRFPTRSPRPEHD